MTADPPVSLPPTRIALGRAHILAVSAIRDAQRAGLPAHSITPAGDLRRFAPDVGEVSLLAVAAPVDHSDLLDGFARVSTGATIASRSHSHVTLASDRGTVTMHVAEPGDAGAALVWYTGARAHIRQLQARARRLDLIFDDARLLNRHNDAVPVTSETHFYRQLDLPGIPPELREGDDEIEVADRGGLPPLVTVDDIRGDLHMHTTWSDGRDSVDHMVYGSQQLGYEYVAITDHSERSLASRQLRGADISRQRAEIEKARTRAPRIHVLHGVEVDIMHDGSLDFDDEQLAGFDIVLASLHDHAGHDGKTLTERYLRAIRHPLVNVITHPANRTPARSPGYDLDFDALFKAAAETGTAMEVDGAPGHLDMDGTLARRAVSFGVMIVIDSDCHRADGLGGQMRFGVGTARRGWVQPAHVLNTRSLADVQAFIHKKRERR